MKKYLLFAAAVAAVIVVAGLAYLYFNGAVLEVRLDENELNRRLARKLPHEKSYGVVKTRVTSAAVHFNGGGNLLVVALKVTLLPVLGKPVNADIEVDGGIRYDAAKAHFYLADPHVDRIALENVKVKNKEKFEQILTRVSRHYLRHYPIYKLKPKNHKLALARLLLRRVRVEDKTLILTMGM